MVQGIDNAIVFLLITFAVFVVVLVCLLAKCKQLIAERLERRRRRKARALL